MIFHDRHIVYARDEDSRCKIRRNIWVLDPETYEQNVFEKYPLVNVYITMGNHNYEWKNSIFLWPCSIWPPAGEEKLSLWRSKVLSKVWNCPRIELTRSQFSGHPQPDRPRYVLRRTDSDGQVVRIYP